MTPEEEARMWARERKQVQRDRDARDGWRHVTVGVPPGKAAEIKQLAAKRRAEYWRENGGA